MFLQMCYKNDNFHNKVIVERFQTCNHFFQALKLTKPPRIYGVHYQSEPYLSVVPPTCQSRSDLYMFRTGTGWRFSHLGL